MLEALRAHPLKKVRAIFYGSRWDSVPGVLRGEKFVGERFSAAEIYCAGTEIL